MIIDSNYLNDDFFVIFVIINLLIILMYYIRRSICSIYFKIYTYCANVNNLEKNLISMYTYNNSNASVKHYVRDYNNDGVKISERLF